MRKVGMIGKVEVLEADFLDDNEAYLISNATVREQVLNLRFVKPSEMFPQFFYKKPKWYQWRLRRKYRRLLRTK